MPIVSFFFFLFYQFWPKRYLGNALKKISNLKNNKKAYFTFFIFHPLRSLSPGFNLPPKIFGHVIGPDRGQIVTFIIRETLAGGAEGHRWRAVNFGGIFKIQIWRHIWKLPYRALKPLGFPRTDNITAWT